MTAIGIFTEDKALLHYALQGGNRCCANTMSSRSMNQAFFFSTSLFREKYMELSISYRGSNLQKKYKTEFSNRYDGIRIYLNV